MGHLNSAILLLSLLALSFHSVHADNYPTIPVDFGDVELTPVARTVTVIGLGNCVCDLTANACDLDCCCDADCTDVEVANIFSVACPPGVSYAPNAPAIEHCVSSGQMMRVNLPSSSGLAVVQYSPPGDDFVGQLLCVVDENSPNFGRFFNDPPSTVTTDDIAVFDSALRLGNLAPSTHVAGSVFVAGDVIPARYASSPSRLVESNGVLSLPLSSGVGSSAICDAVSPVGFGLQMPDTVLGGVEAASCSRYYPEGGQFIDACASNTVYDMALWADLLLAATPGATPAIAVIAGTIQEIDLVTGSRSDSVVQVPTPSEGDTCTGTVVGVEFVIRHSDAGEITTATVNFLIATITVPDVNAPFYVPQQYAVRFVLEGSTSDLVEVKSGVPGYVPGRPLLGGVLVTDAPATDKQAIERFSYGLPLLGAGPDGSCQVGYSDAVTFGVDRAASCLTYFTRDDLQAFCEAGHPSPFLPLEYVNGLFSSSGSGTYKDEVIYIGKWGDSDPNNIEDWVEVDVADPAIVGGMTWSETTGSCTGVVIGLRMDFLYVRVGAANHPQFKMLYAGVKYVTGTWRHHDALNVGSTQGFGVTSYVSFVEKENGNAKTINKVLPEVLPRLNKDVLYPFLGGR